MDNRILNNLRSQLNESIDNEQGAMEIKLFSNMFFSFFKGQPTAKAVYEMLLP